MKFKDGSLGPTTTQIKYLGCMISWVETFSRALRHRATLAEAAYKQLRLVWNSSMPRKRKNYIFQSVFVGTLIYGLDVLTLADKHKKRVNGVYFRFPQRTIGIKASYYFGVSNHFIWRQAHYPKKPSDTSSKLQHKMMHTVFTSSIEGTPTQCGVLLSVQRQHSNQRLTQR